MSNVVSDVAFTKAPKAQQDVTWSITTALVALVTALATARDEIMTAIVANEHILPFLCFLSTHSATPPEALNEALNCLTALSEDNLHASQLIVADQSNCFRALTKSAVAGDSRAVYACACLHNIYSALEWHDGSPGQDGATDAELIPALAQVLDKSKQDAKTYKLSGLEAEVITLALEILASIATGLQASMAKSNKTQEEWNGFGDESVVVDGVDEDQDMKDGEDNDNDDEEEDDNGDEDMEMEDDAILADLDRVTGADSDAEDDTPLQDSPTLHLFVQKALPHLIRLANYAPASEEAIAVQAEALAALNNIAWTMSCFDYSEPGNALILKAWAPIANKLWVKVVAPVLATDTADVGLAARVTSIAWAIARTLQGSTPVVGDEHRKFISLYKASRGLLLADEKQQQQNEEETDPFQALGVKCIGVLGQLAQDPAPAEVNREIGVFLVTTLSGLPETPPADAVEALNQIMDIYGDENHPCDKAVFWKNGFLKHLEDTLPKAKTMVKGIDKRGSTSELRERADEAVLNLGRFIAYKKKHSPRP